MAWESGVLAGLSAGGLDTGRWDLVVGTSAGAFVGARLLGDGSPDPLFAIQTSGNDAVEEKVLQTVFSPGFVRVLRLSRRRPLRWVGLVWLAGLFLTSLMRYTMRRGIRSTFSLATMLRRAVREGDWQVVAGQIGAVANTKRKGSQALTDYCERSLAPTREWPTATLITTAVDTSDGSRALFQASSGVPLVDAVAASVCLPGLLAPVELLGRRYMDGGLASAANADVAAGNEEVWIVSPFRPASLDREVAELQSSGSLVHLVRPSAAAEQVLGPGIGTMDPARRSGAARAGFADGRAAAEAMLAENAASGRVVVSGRSR
jgi:NTE family protein